MATATTQTDGTITVNPNGDSSIALATAGTYVDKNIVFNIEGGGEEIIVNGSAPIASTKLKIEPEIEEIEVLTKDDKNELINKINGIPKIEISTQVLFGNGSDYTIISDKSGYTLINVHNGDWDACSMKVISISRQNSYYVVHFDQYISNGAAYRLNYIWVKTS